MNVKMKEIRKKAQIRIMRIQLQIMFYEFRWGEGGGGEM